MAVTESIIRYADPVIDGQTVRFTGQLHHGSDQPSHVTHSFTCPEPGAFTPNPRPFLLAFLLAAMRLGDPVVVDGPIDAVTLANLMEWQEAMVRWHPGVLSVVPVRGDHEPKAATGATTRAITAFSGGVDSCFAAVRHRPGAPTPTEGATYRRTTVAAGLMVHGFDISRDDHHTFRSAFARSKVILDALDIEAFQVRTDVRALENRFPVDWETASHGIWLASVLSCFEQWYDISIIPSTFAYDHQHLPWASNPLTDPLLGSASTPIWHDGSAYDKLDKVLSIASVAAVANGLRVCWEGDRLDRNCGHCYKCLTTQACLWISGVANPGCFDDPASIEELATIDFSPARRRPLATSLLDGARRAGLADLESAIHQALAR